MRKTLGVCIVAFVACKSPAAVRPDPVHADAKVEVSAKATARTVRAGEILDLGSARVALMLVDKPVSEVNDERRAFLFGKDYVLRAFELADGKEAWSRKIPTTLRPLVMDIAFVYVIGESTITVASKKTGDVRTIAVSKPILRAAAASGMLAIARHDRVVEVFDPNDGSPHPGLTLPFDPIGWHAGLVTLVDRATVCAVASDGALQVLCFGTNGAVRARATVDLRLPAAPKGATFTIVSLDQRYALFGDHPSSSVRRSAVVRLSDGATVARVEDRVASIVTREDGSIAGLLVVDPELRLLDPSGAVRWTAKRAPSSHEGASAIARGNTLFVATYPLFSSGSDLAAYELSTGKPLWKGDVERVAVSHSEYENQVQLSFATDRLLLRGDESYLVTTQLFELATGTRLLAASRQR